MLRLALALFAAANTATPVYASTPGPRDKVRAAVAAQHAGDDKKALSLLDQAEAALAKEKAPDPELAALVARNRGIVLQAVVRYDDALAAFVKSRGLWQRAEDPRAAAAILIDIANLEKDFLFDFPAALKAYEAGVRELRAQHDAEGVRGALVDEANLYLAAGRTQDAIATLNHVLDDTPQAATAAWVHATQILGNAYFRAGAFESARSLAEEALDEADNLPTPRARAVARIDALTLVALTEAEIGDLEAALKTFDVALAAATAAKLDGKRSIVLNDAGYWLREAGRFPAAEEKLRKALAIDGALAGGEGIAYDQRNLGLTLVEAGRAAQAKPLLEAALATSNAHGLAQNAAAAGVGLGLVGLAFDDLKEAEDRFRTARDTAADAAIPDMEWRGSAGLARTLVRAGRRDEALWAFDEALDALEAIEDGLSSDAARRRFKARPRVAAVYRDFAAELSADERYLDAERVRLRARPRQLMRTRGQ